jgi:hemolysin III
MLRNVFEVLDVVIYILHGVSILPFMGIIYDNVSSLDLLLCIVGGVIYICGGVIFGMRRPDPCPKVFGYHEVFHVCTIMANFCFMASIFWGYANNVLLVSEEK